MPKSSAEYFNNQIRRFHEFNHQFDNGSPQSGGSGDKPPGPARKRKHFSHAAGFAASKPGPIESDGQYAIRIATNFLQSARAIDQYRQEHNSRGAASRRQYHDTAKRNLNFNHGDFKIMATAFSNALSGLKANSEAINVVSGNLANENTYGYKANQVSFEELVSSIGGSSTTNLSGGSVVPISSQSFSQGSITTTGQAFDAAIQGNGFFVVKDAGGQQAFTRAGNFTLDATGHLLTQGGENVQGWNGVNGFVNTNSPLTNIVLPVAGLRAPTTTTQFSLNLNLNAGAAVGTTDATFSSPMQVVDSQGQLHTLTVTYTETVASTWTADVTIPSADLAGGVGATTDLTIPPITLTFDPSGNLSSPVFAGGAGAIPVSITGLADGAADMPLTWNLYDGNGSPQITQYDQASANLASSQNGTQAGQLTKISIGANGQITAVYSNGDNVAAAQLAVGTVLNPQSMQDLGSNTFGVTSATAVPAIGTPGTGSRGVVTGGALESSTVDIATEFTNLLIFERGYQANSKVISTEDQVIQTTLGLITGG
jgi:flagellar hook protein FlgE